MKFYELRTFALQCTGPFAVTFIAVQEIFLMVHAGGSFRVEITNSGVVFEQIVDLPAVPNSGGRIAIPDAGNGSILSCYQGVWRLPIQTYEI